MIFPNAAPIANVPPYKRIELGAKPKKPEPKWEPVDPVALEPVAWIDPKFAHPFY